MHNHHNSAGKKRVQINGAGKKRVQINGAGKKRLTLWIMFFIIHMIRNGIIHEEQLYLEAAWSSCGRKLLGAAVLGSCLEQLY